MIRYEQVALENSEGGKILGQNCHLNFFLKFCKLFDHNTMYFFSIHYKSQIYHASNNRPCQITLNFSHFCQTYGT